MNRAMWWRWALLVLILAPGARAEDAAALPDAKATAQTPEGNPPLRVASAAEEVDASAASTDRAAQPSDGARLGLWGRPVRSGGFHLQIGFGVGGGPDTSGLFHTMELGWTFGDYTVALLHTFIQNKGILGTNPNEPDLIGGWMAEFKAPLFFPDLTGKVALGLGGTHEQSNGLIVHAGFGASYGLDLQFPIWERFGPTLTVAAMHVTAEGQHHFGVGTALGITLM